MIRLLPLLLLSFVALAPADARAAESYANCTGFIESLPATISSEGTWCLRNHLYTSQASGYAITVAAENVTIDCNDFRISGLGAGAATQATGIYASKRATTLRHCRVQGFRIGARLAGGGQRVEDNRFEMNTAEGLNVYGEPRAFAWVRRNRITDTGRAFSPATALAAVFARVEDNVIAGVGPATGEAVGIRLNSGWVRRNHVSGVGRLAAIATMSAANVDNTVSGLPHHTSHAIQAASGYLDFGGGQYDLYQWPSVCRGNVARGVGNGYESCVGSDNTVQSP